MALSSLLPLFLLIGTCATWVQERPVLETRDGNLLISSAKDRNISLLTFGASVVNINDINLVEVSISAQKAAKVVEQWERQLMGGLQREVLQLSQDLNVVQQRLDFGGDVRTNSSAARPGRPAGDNDEFAPMSSVGQLTNRVRRVERSLRVVRNKLRENGCAGTPCSNGGTCIRIYDGFQCICPSNWEGPSCESDVNECANFAGTDLGCQNGATCRNLPGTYRCFCRDGWHGIHCTTKLSTCEAQDSTVLCGHGTCIPAKENGYACICDQGWESDGSSPACNKDVNECAAKHPPCSMSPLVPCINIDGGYRCGGCPAGYTGNGHYCNDINECLVDNGGCSTSPRVECINTIGSWTCAHCPAGYQGDGVTCTYVGACRINNGGCSPLATCVETSGYVQCNCMAGYHGTGVGPQGCVVGTDMISPCSVNPCVHGTCLPNGAGFICRCNPGFTGIHCENGLSPCSPNPCQNGGSCRPTDSGGATCNCTSAFTGPRCETRRQSCSALYKNPSGTLEYPSNGQLYEHGLNCAFVILTNMSMVLNITITRFDLEKSQNCRFDFLQIHDGQNAGAHQMGRFCGRGLPFGGNFMTTHNAVYFWLRTDNSDARGGFALSWESVPPTCGGLLTAEHGRIASPGSPGQYPHNRDCRWDIYVRPGKRIQFHFFSVMLEYHPTCENDYLEINETAGNRMVQLGLYCNHTHPAPLLTSGPQATIHFHSDGSGSDTGFQISYTTVEGIPGCGGVYTADQGIISTPGYPSKYASNLNCDWKIQLPKGERIRLTWLVLDIEPQRTCRYDAVQVFSGPDTDSPVIGRYCGSNLPASVVVDSNIALIVFTSDWSMEKTGFQLKYEIVCGGQFRDPTGVLKSPYYPENYPNSRTCIYEIIQPPGKGIILNIVDMEIERPMSRRCFFDGLNIYDGDDENATLADSLCGRTVPSEPYFSTHNYMYLKFFTDGSGHNRGFLANYTTVDRRCGGLLKEPSGLIRSHAVGSKYSENEDCTWTLKAPKGHVVQLSFTTFRLEGGMRCGSDYVMVFDTAMNNQEMGRFCGQTLPPTLRTQGEVMTVKFHTDYSITDEGFIAHYIFVDASRICGGHFFTTTGVLTSPNYPNTYPANKECVWIITAPPKQIIYLNVNEFELESADVCYFDWLEIRNGGSEQSPLMGKYCGTKIPRRIKSLTHEIYLKFVSDSSKHRGGFNISWDASTAGCGGTLSGYKGEIVSPGYPQPYSRLANCLWTISVSAGSKVQIIFVNFELENHPRCRYDYLEISNGADEQRRPGTRYCGTDHPSFIYSDSNLVTLRLRSDYTNNERGFHLRYETICNNKVTGFNGVIESPNFPEVYPNGANCTWIIEAPKGNKINVTFSHFSLEDRDRGDNCTYDYVQISEGESDVPNTELGIFCGNESPGRISSTTNQMFVHFSTDRFTVRDGFRLEWVVVGCGGHLTRPSGELSSPNYPNVYQDNIDCEWLIEVEYGHSVEISFLDVDTEKYADCKFDKIQLYGGADASAPLLAQFCHSTGPINYTSTTNKLFVKLETDFSFAGRGFTAVYKTVDIECGGKFHAAEGFIHSTNYPKNYPNNQNCEWLISVDMNHVVNLTISDLDIEDTTNCTDDYVKVFDGSSRDDMLLGTFCRSEIPPSIVSTGNTILVVMRTDSLITSKGFKAHFSKACGARIVTDGSGVLESTSLLHFAGDEINCTWTIIAKNPADHVTLNFFHMDFNSEYGEQSNCDSRYVQVYEGDGIDGPSRGRWCNSQSPPAIVSNGYALTVHLYASYGIIDDRFGATYSVLDSSCGGEYYSASGSFASPNYPENYGTNATCTWLLKTSPGNRISLTFSAFELERSLNCDRDYLEIREESGIGKLIGTYCTDTPAPIESSKQLWIKFRSDNVGTAKGFRGDYTFLHGNELTGMSGVITSPSYPHPWKSSEEIHWRITVGFGMAVRVEFDQVHIEKMYESCLSKVTVYDGYDENAPVAVEVCGVMGPEKPITSSSNVVYIQFSSDWVRDSNWFRLNWYQVPREPSIDNGVTRVSECEVEYELSSIDNHTVMFSSPGYPDGYKPNLDCTWVITTTPGSHLRMRFSGFDIEESPNCVYDYSTVYNGNGLAKTLDDSQLIAKVCHSNDTNRIFIAKTVMTVKFHSDFDRNGTGIRAFVWRECGGDLSGPDGVIDFNVTKRMYDRRMSIFRCEWNITVRQGKTIKVEFTNFKITTTEPGCKDNYILLKNGAGSESPLLGAGKFCGEKAPKELLQTSGNKLYVKAVGPWALINFKLKYSEVGMDCGGAHRLTGSDTEEQMEFRTPNYPNIPPPFAECFWTFMAPSGGRLALHFLGRFDLTSNPNCTKEYVEVRDGGTEHSILLGRFCGDVGPSSLASTGNMLYVHFYTEVHDPKNGFSAVVTSGELCGGVLRGKTGVIRSPNYPASYPINKICGWLIDGPPDHTLKLEFRDLHLPSLRRCESSTYVSINEERTFNSSVTSFGTFCGTRKPDVLETSSNEAIVSFRSDNRSTTYYRGFVLNYTASRETCGGKLSGLSGEFKTANYPNPNVRSRYCEWTITVPEGSQAVLEILDLDIKDSDNGNYGLHLAISNDVFSRSLITVIQKVPYPKILYGTSRYMTISFFYTAGHRGLRARFTAAAPVPCGGPSEDAMGSLLPPVAPYNATSFFCQWNLKAPDTMMNSQNITRTTLTLTISGVFGSYPQESTLCAYRSKYIRLHDGVHKLGSVCGNLTHKSVTMRSPAPFNTVEILNGTSGGPIDFDVKYEWKACGGILTGPSHVIRSPNNMAYPHSCVWHAKFEDPAANLRLTFNRINLGSCDKGYIIVRNGGPLSPQIGKYCGNIKPSNITSSSGQLWIEYWASEAPGDFEIGLNQITGSCGGTIRGANKELISPGFPISYPNNTECTWEIVAEVGHSIGFVFVDRFNIETSDGCTNDFVQLFDWIYDDKGIGAWKEHPKLCGRDRPRDFNSTTNRMKVLFRSNGAVEGDGFRAIWEENCGGLFEASRRTQLIESPNYPDSYPPNKVCNYTITGPKGQKIWVEFLDFKLEGRQGRCKWDNVTTEYRRYGIRRQVWCGDAVPPTFSSDGTVSVLFKSDAYVSKSGFQFKFFVNDCGGDITEPTEIGPPVMKDNKYFTGLNCTWVIRAPEGKSVVLRFTKFELEQSHSCSFDSVLVFEGPSLSGKRLAKLCGNVSDPFPVRSVGNAMTVSFRSDSSNNYGGMRAQVLFTKSIQNGCGGSVHVQQSTSFRTQKAAMYENFEDCHWSISADAGKIITLTINSMDLKNKPNNTRPGCYGDYLEVHDGMGPFSDLIGTYCGSDTIPPIQSSLNALWIRFYTDGSVIGEGVTATLTATDSPCGKNVWDVTNETVIMKSPGYPGDYPAGMQCRWIFRASDSSYSQLRVHFEEMNLEDSENCVGDHFEISDEANKYISQDFGEDMIYHGKQQRRLSRVSTLARVRLIGMRYGSVGTFSYCGQMNQFDYHSGSNEIHVLLKTTVQNLPKPRKYRFEVEEASCSRNYTAEQGRIVHQGFKECWTTITTQPNRTISIYFNKFRMYDYNNCSGTYMKIYQGDNKAPNPKTICGLMIPSPIFSTGNLLTFYSHTDRSNRYGSENYDITFTTTDKGPGCGGKIFNFEGTFTSPMYPMNYRNESMCQWEISVPRGFQVLLRFRLFDLGTSEICATDYMQIVEQNISAGRTETYCPGQTPAAFRSNSNVVVVTYFSSVNNGGTGWIINFKAVHSTDTINPYMNSGPRLIW